MNCDYENCKRKATQGNLMYFPDKWYCTYHANKATKEGRRFRKYGNRIVEQKEKEEDNA